MADHKFPGEHVYEGMMMEPMVTDDSIEKIKHLDVVEGDIVVASYPKTGTTVMEELTWLLTNKSDLEKANPIPLHQRMLYIEATFGSCSSLELLSQKPRPAIMKTHLPGSILEKSINEGKLKVILMIRNPKDTLVSFYHFYRMNNNLGNFTGTWDEFFEFFLSKRLVYGDFFDWYSSWLPFLNKPNIELFKFEDIVKRRSSVVSRLSDVLGKSLSQSDVNKIVELTSFTSMKENKQTNYEDFPFLDMSISPFMRKGQVGDWKNYFNPRQSAIIDQAYENLLEKGGPVLEFE